MKPLSQYIQNNEVRLVSDNVCQLSDLFKRGYLYFFTDIQTDISNYCLLNINKYSNEKKNKKKVCFIDPGVYELVRSNEYSHIDILHELASGKLLKNEYISIDYPCDMNLQYQDEFIEKSIKNNLKYKDNPQYICTIQFKFQDFSDFKKQFEYLEEQIDFSKKIVGIGNLCRIMKVNEFTEKVFHFLLKKPKYQYHFYGLALILIKKYISSFLYREQIVSVDSTKWTRACNYTIKNKFGVNCTKKNRDLFFLEYIKELKKYIPNIIF